MSSTGGGEAVMKRIRMALDESLVQEFDRAAQALGTTRSDLTRDALREALGCLREGSCPYRVGYEKKPAQPEESLDLPVARGRKPLNQLPLELLKPDRGQTASLWLKPPWGVRAHR
jgi:hypothetical protein